MKLHELKASAGARKAVTRKGRGAGSGNGKTAGFGHKGQKARSGVKKAGFEGGQMPLQRRLPKRGFNNIFATKYVTIKVSDLEKFEAGATVDTEALLKAGIISKTLDGVKVLLCHKPEHYIKYLRTRALDLVVAGHAHGGQIRVAGRGVFSPGQGLFPRYTCGVVDGRMVISAGAGNPVHLPRWGNPCEVLRVTLD